jgi:hypothetical protein
VHEELAVERVERAGDQPQADQPEVVTLCLECARGAE